MATRTEKLGMRIGKSIAAVSGNERLKKPISHYFKLLLGYFLIAPGLYAGIILLIGMVQQKPNQIHDIPMFNTELNMNLTEKPRLTTQGHTTGEKSYQGSIQFFGQGPTSSGGKPVMLGLLAIAGVYLVKDE